jgi:hypothetical protein
VAARLAAHYRLQELALQELPGKVMLVEVGQDTREALQAAVAQGLLVLTAVELAAYQTVLVATAVQAPQPRLLVPKRTTQAAAGVLRILALVPYLVMAASGAVAMAAAAVMVRRELQIPAAGAVAAAKAVEMVRQAALA